MPKTLRAKCLEAAQKLARIAAANDHGMAECVTCGIVEHYKDMDGGHFIPKGNSSYWALEMENIHPQCKGCNGFQMKHGTASLTYTMWMIDYYGRSFVDEMIATKNKIKKMYKKDYEELLAELKEQIKYHEKRIGEI